MFGVTWQQRADRGARGRTQRDATLGFWKVPQAGIQENINGFLDARFRGHDESKPLRRIMKGFFNTTSMGSSSNLVDFF